MPPTPTPGIITKADPPPFPSSAAFLPVMWEAGEAGDAFCGAEASLEQEEDMLELGKARRAGVKLFSQKVIFVEKIKPFREVMSLLGC